MYFPSFAKQAALVYLGGVLNGPTLTGINGPPTDTPTKATGKLPALGWNSWTPYRCNIDEGKILAAANDIVSLGLKDAGYEYVNIDDCWSEKAGRDPTTGRIVPDAKRFPNGIQALGTKIHNLGLKIGIYSDAGILTCEEHPGSLGHEATDAATFSEWGIDYLKYDNCNVPKNWTDSPTPPGNDWYNSNSAIRYRQMTGALAGVSRPIQYSICIWGLANVWEWGARVGHSWRISYDAGPYWNFIMLVIRINVGILSSIDFYSHNDMDIMEIGNGALTVAEQRTHFAAWAFLKSPILLGTDLSKLSPTILAIIKNRELLAFHQDPNIGTSAKPFTAFSGMPTTSPPEYFSGNSSKGTHVFIINTQSTPQTKEFKLSNVPGLGTSGNFKIHDMWTGTDLDETYAASSTFSVRVLAHDTVAYFISKL